MVLIKYYPNRRLYRIGVGKYIAYNHIRQYVHDGLDFKVVHSRSGKDVTASVLIKALVDIGSDLSVSELRALIELAPLESGRKKARNMLSIARMTKCELEESDSIAREREFRGGYNERLCGM